MVACSSSPYSDRIIIALENLFKINILSTEWWQRTPNKGNNSSSWQFGPGQVKLKIFLWIKGIQLCIWLFLSELNDIMLVVLNQKIASVLAYIFVLIILKISPDLLSNSHSQSLVFYIVFCRLLIVFLSFFLFTMALLICLWFFSLISNFHSVSLKKKKSGHSGCNWISCMNKWYLFYCHWSCALKLTVCFLVPLLNAVYVLFLFILLYIFVFLCWLLKHVYAPVPNKKPVVQWL